MPIILATGFGEIGADPGLKMRRLGKPFSQADLRTALAAVVKDLNGA